MALYQTGTVSVTNGSNIVAGTGTSFLANVGVGDSFKVNGVTAIYNVISVDSDTQIQISPNYAGATDNNAAYQTMTLGSRTPALGLAEITPGLQDWTFWLTTEVIRKLDTYVARGGTFWLPPQSTPVRVDNSTFTVADAGNASHTDLIMSRGTVLKWTDGGVIKQAMVSNSVYSADTVTITVIGESLSATAAMNTLRYSIQKAQVIYLALEGPIVVSTDMFGHFQAPYDLKIYGADVMHGTAGATGSTSYIVKKNGLSLFTTPISVASGATAGLGFTANNGSYLVLGDVVTVDCTAASTTAPIDAYLNLFVSPRYDKYLT